MIVGFHYETAAETVRKHRKKIRYIFLPIVMYIILQDYKASNTNDKHHGKAGVHRSLNLLKSYLLYEIKLLQHMFYSF
jgi:hypothetical protein